MAENFDPLTKRPHEEYPVESNKENSYLLDDTLDKFIEQIRAQIASITKEQIIAAVKLLEEKNFWEYSPEEINQLDKLKVLDTALYDLKTQIAKYHRLRGESAQNQKGIIDKIKKKLNIFDESFDTQFEIMDILTNSKETFKELLKKINRIEEQEITMQ